MAWPLTGRALADFNRMLNDWKQYSTFPFIGPDDIDRLYNVLLAAGLRPQLEDVGNRPQYWLLQLVSQVGSGGSSQEFASWSPASINLGDVFFLSSYGPDALTGITDLTFSAVTNSQGVQFTQCDSLVNLSFPNLVSSDFDFGFIINDNISLVTVNFPRLTGAPGCLIRNNTVLQTIDFSSFVFSNGQSYDFSGNALDATTVNALLARAVLSGVTTCTIDLTGGSSSAPTGQGIADKTALNLAGNTVTTN